MNFATKGEARAAVWRALDESGAAAFPRPARGRIPNFVGSAEAAARLREHPLYRAARAIKVNPDYAQHAVRANALRDGKIVYMPTPRLRAGFVELRPERLRTRGSAPPSPSGGPFVPAGEEHRATTITACRRYGREVPLDRIERIDLIVCGSVAVAPDGGRAGKGEGYSDLEYAILRELGQGEIPVFTTVHELQVVGSLPREPFDLTVDAIFTPERTIEVKPRPPKPPGIDWARLPEERIEEMPPLQALRKLRG